MRCQGYDISVPRHFQEIPILEGRPGMPDLQQANGKYLDRGFLPKDQARGVLPLEPDRYTQHSKEHLDIQAGLRCSQGMTLLLECVNKGDGGRGRVDQ